MKGMKKYWTELSFAEMALLVQDRADQLKAHLANFRHAASKLFTPAQGLFQVVQNGSVIHKHLSYKAARKIAEIFEADVVNSRTGRTYYRSKRPKAEEIA